MIEQHVSLLHALAANQNTEPDKLHEIDSSDVAISREALAAVGDAARALLAGAMGASGAGSLTLGDIVKLFAAKLFWSEAGGELIMCGAVLGRTVCLPVPAGHWNVAAPRRVQ